MISPAARYPRPPTTPRRRASQSRPAQLLPAIASGAFLFALGPGSQRRRITTIPGATFPLLSIPNPLAKDGNTIMCSNTTIVRGRQLTIRRELDRRGISLKGIAFDSRIPYPTLLSYFPGDDREPHTLSAAAIFALCGVLPHDLISLILPDGFQIVRAPEDIDHDQLADAMADYLAEKQHAHHPDSPAGREIADSEDAALCSKLAVVRAAA